MALTGLEQVAHSVGARLRGATRYWERWCLVLVCVCVKREEEGQKGLGRRTGSDGGGEGLMEEVRA